MANFVASQLVAAQAKITQRFQEQELRRKQNPAAALAFKNLSATIPGHVELRGREDRPVSAYVFARKAATNGTARASRPSGPKGNTFAYGLTWQTISESFNISLKQGDSNLFSREEMLQNELMQAVQAIHDRLGTTLLAYISAHRNGLPLTSPSGASWNTDNNAYEIASGDATFFFQKLGAIMRQHNYRGLLDVIGDSTAFQKASQLRAQGQQNAQNLAFQFDNINLLETTEAVTAVAGYTKGAAFAMPEATLALLPWIPKQNRNGWGDMDTYNGGYGIMDDPFGTSIMVSVPDPTAPGKIISIPVPLQYAVYAYTVPSDDSANNGGTQDQVTTFEISLDIAPTLAPLSGVNESVCSLFAQL